MEPQQPETSNSGPHLIAGVMGITKNMFGLLLNRVELAALELSEIRANLLALALFFALGLIAAWFAVAYWSVLLVYLAWDALGWKILLILAVVFTALAIGAFLHVRSMIAEGRLSMPATMNELRNDRDALL